MTTRTPRATLARSSRLALEPSALDAPYVEGARESGGVGEIACVDIVGPLMQRGGWWLGYDDVRAMLAEALASSAHTVVLRIDSPGGECAGAFEAVRAMRADVAASGKRVVAYADEAAYSAAYAIATVASEIYVPASGGVGSVGVISTLLDVSARNAAEGFRVEVITSGARKADGNPDVPLSDDAIAREQAVVSELGTQFCELVSEARPLSGDEVAALEAACLYGEDAVDAGLADGVTGWDALLAELTRTSAQSGARTMRRRGARRPTMSTSATEAEEQATETTTEVTVTTSEAPAEEPADDEGGDGEDMAAAAARPAVRTTRDVLAYVRELTGEASPAAQVASLRKMSRELATSRRAAQKAAEAEREARLAGRIDRAVREGKLAPGQRAWAMQTARTSPAVLDAFLASAVPAVRTAAQGPTPAPSAPAVSPTPDATSTLTAADRRAAQVLGVSLEAYAEQKAKLAGAGHFGARH